MNISQLMNRSVKMEIENEKKSLCSNSYRKKKRFRSAFTTDQINGLEIQYKRYPYIGIVNRKAIAKSLNIPEKAVKIWFQNRRMKEKRDKTNINHEENHKAVNLVNDQSRNSSATQSSNDPVPNSFPPQVTPRTGLTKEGGDDFLKRYVEPLPRVKTMDKTETHTVTSMPKHHSIPQIPAGYVPSYMRDTQSCYQQACLPVGNVLWKSVEPNMAGVMPVNQFALLPHPAAQNLSMQGRKCFCNCHGNSQPLPSPGYSQENQLSPHQQYVFAVPFHNASHFTYPI